MKKFKLYYLIWFISFGVLTIVGLFNIESKFDYKVLLLVIFTSVIIPLCLGRLFDWTENVWTPKRRKKYYNQEPLSNLLNLGFKNIDDIYFIGRYKNYNIDIEYNHTMDRLLVYSFYYEPESFENKEFDRINKLLKIHKINIDVPGIIPFAREVRFRIPKLEIIEAELTKCCEIFEDSVLKSITKLELNQLYKESQINKDEITHYNTIYSS
jgi:hypothetical protein